MDKAEAQRLLDRELATLRVVAYAELRARIPQSRRRFLFVEIVTEEQTDTREVVGDSGAVYQLETQVWWDGKPEADIRVSPSSSMTGQISVQPLD